MKKFKFLLLVLLMLVVLTSCKFNKTDGDESKTEPPVAETMVTPIYEGVTFETAEAYALKAKKEKNPKKIEKNSCQTVQDLLYYQTCSREVLNTSRCSSIGRAADL